MFRDQSSPLLRRPPLGDQGDQRTGQRHTGREDPEAMAAAFDEYADALRPALAGHWAAR